MSELTQHLLPMEFAQELPKKFLLTFCSFCHSPLAPVFKETSVTAATWGA
jgi:hypothetical protein